MLANDAAVIPHTHCRQGLYKAWEHLWPLLYEFWHKQPPRKEFLRTVDFVSANVYGQADKEDRNNILQKAISQ